MRVIFFGSTDFSCRMLSATLEAGHEVVSVVTLPDRPDSRGRPQPTPVKSLANELNLPLIEVENLKEPSFAESLRELRADIGIVVSFKILPQDVFTAPRLGTLNIHPSILPKLRGPAPVRWALIEGFSETGVTSFILDDKVDTGDIICVERVSIGPEDNYEELFQRIYPIAKEVLLKSLSIIESGNFVGVKQDPSEATKAPKIRPEICRINWIKGATEIHNLVRALSPLPGAWTELEEIRFKILRARPIKASGNPGEVLSCEVRNGLVIACGEDAIEVLQIQAPGKRPLECGAFLCGCKLTKGKVFI